MTKVLLAGGLGNQLFQFSAGKYLAGEGDLQLIYGIHPVRKLEDGSQVFSDSILRGHAHTSQESFMILNKKLFNFALRRSAKTTVYAYDKKIISKILSLSLFLFERKRERIFINNGIGWDSRLAAAPKDSLMIGYFQSYVVGSIGQAFVAEMLTHIQLPKTFHIDESNTMIHIRLTDYMDAKSLGHLSDLYYKKALQILGFPMNQEYKVFTDGKKEDLNKSFRFARNLDSVDTNELNSWQVLKIMALHKNFIIANSSFSWWAANLKRSSAGKVIAPKIWFLKDGPEGIHNPSWILI